MYKYKLGIYDNEDDKDYRLDHLLYIEKNYSNQ